MAYSLATSFIGDSLISGFEWFNGIDPSHGFVQYQDLAGAEAYGLYSVDPFSGTVRLRPDSDRKVALNTGRPSVRLESKESFQYGLFIADFQHMPISQCGTWPAFWTYGANWPMKGEVDILEGANLAYTNIMSAHTADGCMLDPADSNLFSGERLSLDCAVGTDNVGCGFTSPNSDTSSYGDGFNAVGGGVYAMEWDSEYISIWHFPRGAIPADIEGKRPDPSKWGLPQSLFGGSKCNVDEYFNDMRIVLNINFCGDYGEGTWTDSATCRALAPTCREYVAQNPRDFQDAYFDVSYIDVYTRLRGKVPPVVPSSSSSTTSPQISVSEAGTHGSNTPISGGTRSPSTSFSNSTSIVTRPRPGEQASETGGSSILVTIPGSGTGSPTVSTLPVATGGSSVNPDKIGDYSYLGCFRSQTGFQTFDEAVESDDMTIEKLDGDTRAIRNETSCNRPCPGNDDQFCGGMVSQRSRRSIPLRRDVPNNILLTVYADISDAGQPEVPPGMGPGADGTTAVSGEVGGGPSTPTAESVQGGSAGAGSDDLTASNQDGSGDSSSNQDNPVLSNLAGLTASNELATSVAAATNIRLVVDTAAATATATVTDTASIHDFAVAINTAATAGTDVDANPVIVFGTLSDGQVLEATQAFPETGQKVVTRTITFFTVFPSNPGSLVPQENIVTMSYSQCAYCETPTLVQPPMETRVVECDGCGTNGENIVTLTLPISVTVTVPGTNTTEAQATGNAVAGVISDGSGSSPEQTREIPPVVPSGMGDDSPGVTTIVITYLTTRLVTYGTSANSVSTETRTMRRTVVMTISDSDGEMSILPVPSPGHPTSPVTLATPTPGAPGEPIMVSGASSRADDFFVYFAIVAMAILALSL
ncbi:hypothetical protein F53441_1025 [Fusarium austroafricanum]|uniref:GH16 domain-containing protein n=1 Tax=Fusarium austroafricanum TaxID=2364996 RepID=A0A8H4KVR2_9HYPO|nr:hypothetical protein F53441_1025 [Fusarium austroafricanum]